MTDMQGLDVEQLAILTGGDPDEMRKRAADHEAAQREAKRQELLTRQAEVEAEKSEWEGKLPGAVEGVRAARAKAEKAARNMQDAQREMIYAKDARRRVNKRIRELEEELRQIAAELAQLS